MAARIELSAELITLGWYYHLVMAMVFVMLGIVSMIVIGPSILVACYLLFGAHSLLRWWVRVRLKRIEIEGDALYISDFLGRGAAVHLASVSDVRERRAYFKSIKLSLAVDTRFGRTLKFRPKGSSSGPWRPQPAITFLKERVAAARVGIPQRSPVEQYAQQYAELQADMRRLRETEGQAHSRQRRMPE